MAQRQLRLSDEPLENNRAFMRKLFELDLHRQFAYFDKLPYAAASRVDDPEMDLETFIANMHGAFVVLTLEKDNFPGPRKRITCFVRGVELPGSLDERFAHWSAPHNQKNYAKIARLFSEAYGRPIE